VSDDTSRCSYWDDGAHLFVTDGRPSEIAPSVYRMHKRCACGRSVTHTPAFAPLAECPGCGGMSADFRGRIYSLEETHPSAITPGGAMCYMINTEWHCKTNRNGSPWQ